MNIIFEGNENFSAIEITKNGKKAFLAKIPYDLKNEFRSAFKSAKWQAEEKAWLLGSRSGKRLIDWLEIALPKYDEFLKEKEKQDALQESLELEESEIKAIDLRLAELRKELKRKDELELEISYLKEALKRKSKEKMTLKSLIDRNKPIVLSHEKEIEALKRENKKANDENNELIEKNKAVLEGFALNIDRMAILVDEIINVLSTVRIGSLISKYNKGKLDNLQNELRSDFILPLENFGYSVKFLNRCYDANGNRPDRDLAWLLEQEKSAMFILEEIE